MQMTIIGGGNMATALLSGLVQRGFDAAAITVIGRTAEKLARLQTTYGVVTGTDPAAAVAAGEVVLLAVKPQQLADVCRQIAPHLRQQLVISVAAGVRTQELSHWLGQHAAIVRAMPNTPAQVLKGVTGLFATAAVSAAQREAAARILGAVGTTVWLEEETGMDAITAVSGSGPAYAFYFMEALAQAAEELGFTAAEARRLSVETFSGACALAAQSSDPLGELRRRVTSKGGTTERALETMEAHSVKAAIIAAVHAAAARSKELGDALAAASQKP